MGNSFFRFKKFTIHHDYCAMKVGTDGVLLGAWADVQKSKNILDIGTGSGLIAIMTAQRSNAQIDAVEIDEKSCLQAKENILSSPWPERINVINISFQNFSVLHKKKYDHIITNPPFFENSLKPEFKEKEISKHNDLLPFNDLLDGVKNLLSADGKFSIILPSTEGNKFANTVENHSLFLNRKLTVFPCPWKPASRLLMEFSYKKMKSENNELTIELNERHDYSEEYKLLTRDFYLNF